MRTGAARLTIVVAGWLTVALLPLAAWAEVDTGVIRLGSPKAQKDSERPDEPALEGLGADGRRGFDYDAFERRFESFWFQRKAFLADGRDEDAHRQSELIRNFCVEEGVGRLEAPAGALVAEARRYLEQGSYEKALAGLDLAQALDDGRPQIHFGRAMVLWTAGEGHLEAVGEIVKGLRGSAVRAWTDLTLPNVLSVVAVVALLASVVVFASLMVFKYNAAFRHEVEEWMTVRRLKPLGPAAGWALLLLPLLSWILAGWIILYWIVLTFRFMRRSERLAAVLLLVATAFTVPAFKVTVALYGVMTDPAVRTTLESAKGGYSPDKIVKLKKLVEAHPDDPVYSFLLAGLYKDGRYFEEAYSQYRQVLEIAPSNYQAHINLGNIFYQLGQYGDSIAEYVKALEINSDSVLAHYNMYLAQSESFDFKGAEQTLRRAQQIDSGLATRYLSETRDGGERSVVQDASIQTGSVWRAALEGRPLRATLDREEAGGIWQPLPRQFLNPVSLAALVSLAACGVILVLSRVRSPARRCIRCGRPFCHHCRSGREGREYCSQCLHLFVIGDGLAPETKTRKLYEVERHERSVRRRRKLFSVLLPGAAHVLRGFAGRGCAFIFLWVLAVIAWRPSILAPLERLVSLDLGLGLLRSGGVPAAFGLEPSGAIALVGAVAVWLTANSWLWRRREA